MKDRTVALLLILLVISSTTAAMKFEKLINLCANLQTEQTYQRDEIDKLNRLVYDPCHECQGCHGNRIQDCLSCHEEGI